MSKNNRDRVLLAITVLFAIPVFIDMYLRPSVAVGMILLFICIGLPWSIIEWRKRGEP